MAQPQLRVYYGPSEAPPKSAASALARECVSVPLGEILPALASAVRTRRAWVRDFADDEVTISTDLYQVIQAYLNLRPSA
jgi:hypothetical protein